MSIKVMTWVWDNAELSGAELLLLLAIADHANDEGECYPSVKRLAKMARVSKSHSQTLIRTMKDNKIISVVLNAGITTGRGSTNRFYVNGYRAAMGLPFIASTNTIRKPLELRKPKKSLWGTVNSTGTVDNTPTDTTDNISGVLPIISKPSLESLEEPLPLTAMKLAVKTLLKQYNPSQCENVAKSLLGLHSDKKKVFNLDMPITVEDLPIFCAWWDKKKDKNGVSLTRPRNMDSILAAVNDWQATKTRKSADSSAARPAQWGFVPDMRSEAEIKAQGEQGE